MDPRRRKKPVMFSAVSSCTLLTTASSTPRGHGHACQHLPLTLENASVQSHWT
jgi:hypothetical protein